VNYVLPVRAEFGEMSLFASVYWQDKMLTSQIKSILPEVAYLQGWPAQDLATARSDVNLQDDDYAIVNLRYDWADMLGSGLEFSAYIDNATDEE
jgi:hypothetical protein